MSCSPSNVWATFPSQEDDGAHAPRRLEDGLNDARAARQRPRLATESPASRLRAGAREQQFEPASIHPALSPLETDAETRKTRPLLGDLSCGSSRPDHIGSHGLEPPFDCFGTHAPEPWRGRALPSRWRIRSWRRRPVVLKRCDDLRGVRSPTLEQTRCLWGDGRGRIAALGSPSGGRRCDAVWGCGRRWANRNWRAARAEPEPKPCNGREEHGDDESSAKRGCFHFDSFARRACSMEAYSPVWAAVPTLFTTRFVPWTLALKQAGVRSSKQYTFTWAPPLSRSDQSEWW